MATGGDDLAGVNVKVPAASGQQPTPLCGADDCGQPVQLPSNSYCLQCAQWFCSGCLKDHNRFLKGHTLTDNPVTRGNKQSASDPSEKDRQTARPYSRCPTHGQEPEKFYCGECSAVMCSKCLDTHDSDHNFTKIELQVAKVMTELRKKTQEVVGGVDEEEVRAAELQKQITSFGAKAAEEEQELVARLKLIAAPYSNAIKQNKRAARDYSDRVQKQLDDVHNKIKEIRAFLKRVDELASDSTKFTQTDVVRTVIPTVSGPGHDVIPPPRLVTHSHIRRGVKHVGCQMTVTCNYHGTVRFRRPVDEIQLDTDYYSDESIVGHVPWSIHVRYVNYEVPEFYVYLISDRLRTLSADYEAEVEYCGRIPHPTEPEKHVSRGKRSHTFTRHSRFASEWFHKETSLFVDEQDLEDGGHIADGFLTLEVDIHVKACFM